MSERILVTGGAGFIGSHLVDALLAAGHEVRVFDNLVPQVHGSLRDEGQWPEYCNPDAEYILGDVRDREALRVAMQGVDAIFHEAAAVGVAQSMYDVERYVDVNARGTAVLLDLLVNEKKIRERMRKLVVASSMSIYGEGAYTCPEHGAVYPKLRPNEQLEAREWETRCPIYRRDPSPAVLKPAAGDICNLPLQSRATNEDKPSHCTSIYAITKRDQEEMCLTTGRACKIPTVALRYFNVYGPRQALSNPYTGVAAIFSARILNDQPPVIFEDGLQSRDFVHVSDIVRANLLVLANDRADHEVLNVGTGKALTILDMANALIQHMGSSLAPEVINTFRSGDIRHCFADISRIRSLGYQPCVRFEDGIPELVKWVQAQSAADQFEQAQTELDKRQLTI